MSEPSDPPPEQLPEPGWFADPERPGQLRWWDGAAWTEHRTADPAAAPSQSPAEWRTGEPEPQAVHSGPARTSGWAIAALVFGLPLPLLGIVFGVIARQRIKDARGALTGIPYANAGIALGSLAIVVSAGALVYSSLTSSTNAGRYAGAEKPVAALVDHVQTALSKHDGRRACTVLFTETFASRIADGSGQSCTSFVGDAVASGEFQAEIKVKSIDITGRQAQVEVTEGGDAQIWSMERGSGGWRLDEISA